MTTSQLGHYGLRMKCYLQLLQQKQQLLLVLFVLQPQKYGTAYPSQSNQPRPSTSSAACLKDTCLAMPLDDRHSHPEPLHRRLISRRIMAPLTNYIDIDIAVFLE